jgi:hypothetical protein
MHPRCARVTADLLVDEAIIGAREEQEREEEVMGEKPEADEDLTRSAGSAPAAGIAVGEEGVQRASAGRPPTEPIAIDEEGVQRQGGAMSAIGNIRGREAAGGAGPVDPAESSNLNLSKSNINREAGGEAGAPDAAATNLNTSRSNVYREAGDASPLEDEAAEGSVKSSKSNTSD